jgi:hypothetical protein
MAPLPVIYCSMAQAQQTSLGLLFVPALGRPFSQNGSATSLSSIDPSQPVFDASDA